MKWTVTMTVKAPEGAAAEQVRAWVQYHAARIGVLDPPMAQWPGIDAVVMSVESIEK